MDKYSYKISMIVTSTLSKKFFYKKIHLSFHKHKTDSDKIHVALHYLFVLTFKIGKVWWSGSGTFYIGKRFLKFAEKTCATDGVYKYGWMLGSPNSF